MTNLKTLSFFGAMAIGAIVIGNGASADVLHPGNGEFTNKGAVGPWTIYADHDRGSCLIEGVDPAGFVVQMGLTDNEKVAYVGVFSKTYFEDAGNSKSDISITVNGRAYTGEMTEMRRKLEDGYRGGYVLANNPDFVRDIQKGHHMMAKPEKGTGVIINLDGTYNAIEAAKDCTSKM